jgi:hypothetical protein
MSAVRKFVHFLSKSLEKLLVLVLLQQLIGFTWYVLQSFSVCQHEKGL